MITNDSNELIFGLLLARHIYFRNEISMKTFNNALHRAYFFIFYLTLSLLTPALAAENTSVLIDTYQSSFEGYQPLTDERLADWKTINAQANSNEHAGHSMDGMDHAGMKDMSENKMSHSATMPPMPTMQEMDHAKSMPDKKTHDTHEESYKQDECHHDDEVEKEEVDKLDGHDRHHHGDEQGSSHEHQ